MVGPTQPCSTEGCNHIAAFSTRVKPAFCVSCIDGFFRAGGVEPVEPFTARNGWRRTECLTCGVRLPYRLDFVLDKNIVGEAVCRVCFWGSCARQRNHKTELDEVIGTCLSRPTGLTEDEKELIAMHGPARQSIARWWWPTERTRATVALLHHDLLIDTGEHNDGWDPVVLRCQLCGTESVQLPGRMESELSGHWCLCQSCNRRNPGPCASDVLVGFAAHSMTIAEPRSGAETIQEATCSRCGTPRAVSMRGLNANHVPCYVCDGAADPGNPHRVYLFHFPAWHAFKVGITNTGNDFRLTTHLNNGGVLIEIVTVPHRAAAFWMEDQVLSNVRAWPVAGIPVERSITGWTEMWRDDAPITVRLSQHLPLAQAIPVDPVQVDD